jgi:hypothetical protein
MLDSQFSLFALLVGGIAIALMVVGGGRKRRRG